MKTLGQKLREIRKRLKLSQKQFAEKLGYTYKNVCNWENGHNNPSTHTIKRIHDIFGVDYNDIFDFEK